MKKAYFLGIGMALLLLTSCGPKRHSCFGKRRCISYNQTEQARPVEIKKAAVSGSFFA